MVPSRVKHFQTVSTKNKSKGLAQTYNQDICNTPNKNKCNKKIYCKTYTWYKIYIVNWTIISQYQSLAEVNRKVKF